jgi:hypothetical protein
MTMSHQDSAHGAHCTNQNCAMYWAVEGASGMVTFVKKFVTTNSAVIWGDECLADAAAAGN